MRGKGEGGVYRVPKDKTQPLKYWTAVIELPPGPNGARRRQPIRRKSKAEAVAELDRLKAELQARGDLPSKSQTAETWFNYWLTNIAKKNVRPNTYDGYRRTVENHIIPAIGKVKLDKITPDQVRRVHAAIIDKGLNSTTALLAHRTMSVSFKAAVREGRIGRNPASLVTAPKKAATSLEALDVDQAIALLGNLANHPYGALWATVLLTGGRRGEILGLERDRVTDVLDLSWQLLRLPKTGVDGKPDVPADYEYRHVKGGLYLTRPKSSTSWRIIPLVDPLRSILRAHIANTPDNPWGLVFPHVGVNPPQKVAPYSPDRASRDWRTVLKEAGIDKNVRLHDGRHTTVDLLLAAGVPEDLIQEIVGHSTRMQTRAYKSLRNRERLSSAMEMLSTLIETPRQLER